MKIFLSIILSVFFQNLVGQIIPYTTDAEISSLIAKNAEYVIRFSLPPKYSYSDFSYDTTLQRRFSLLFDVEYLIYKSNGRLYSIEIISHCNEDCSNIIETKSLPTNFTNNLINDELIQKRFELKNEEILPYTYSGHIDSTKKHILEVSHPPYFRIAIYNKVDTLSAAFNIFNFSERISESAPANLNYEINSRTLTYKYFLKLEAYFKENSNQFHFQK